MVNLLLNFRFRLNITSETSGKLKNSWHWLMISEDPVLKILNKMRLRGNPSYLRWENNNTCRRPVVLLISMLKIFVKGLL